MYTLILGLDAFDPQIFEKLSEKGLLPNLTKFLDINGYAQFTVSNPPQSEVSWSSIATGLDPSWHGIFDFVHRDPRSYQPFVSLLPTRQTRLGVQFSPPLLANTIFDQAASDGYPSTSLWWPATFPARPDSLVKIIPGLGTPDIQGRLGVGALYTTGNSFQKSDLKTPVETLTSLSKTTYTGTLHGPTQQKKGQASPLDMSFRLEIENPITSRLTLGNKTYPIKAGVWSPVIEVSFKVNFAYSLKAITRVMLTKNDSGMILYFLPLQIHPLHSPWPYGAQPGFVRDAWNSTGPFLTLGWPQDTTGLEEGGMSDANFLELCQWIDDTREQVLLRQLSQFKEGLIGVVFDSLDRLQHMFLRDQFDLIQAYYQRLDGLVGRIGSHLAQVSQGKARLLVVSDHGFSRFDYKVHLNRWLVENGFLTVKENSDGSTLQQVDWTRTQVYAIGLNSLFLNLAGREGQGSVQPDAIEALLARLSEKLTSWLGPDHRPVVQRLYHRNEIYDGPLSAYGPDLLVGYSAGFRASSQTGLGAWEAVSIEANTDHWGADHCIEPTVVPGVLFSNRPLDGIAHPSYKDFPDLAIGREVKQGKIKLPALPSPTEDQQTIEERLKSLGYL